ncbi:imelysin family protein [Streptomyces sp. NPDC087270]|uniref:imelysin family protein n=1 Tax=Streptomyces sp. NPDC087270 TaxID=3365774 RepID=UPI0038291E01
MPAEPEPESEPASADGGPAYGSRPDRAAKGAAPRWGGGRRRIVAAAVAALVAAAITTGVLVSAGHHDASTGNRHPLAADGLRHTPVDASPGSCGRGWGGPGKVTPRSGTQVFDLHNSSASATDVDLIDPHTGKVYGEVEGLAPAGSRPMVVDLGSGTYAFKCLQEDTDAVTGPTVTVPGTAPRGPAGLPVTEHDLIPPTLAYQTWIGTRMAELVGDTGALKEDVDRGDLAAARRDWLAGHLVYERMGAAYDTFGDADGVINGTTAIGRDPLKDPDFTGFHRIEYGLWHGESAKSLRGQAATLDKAVRALRATWSTQRMDPMAMGLRAHEIIENAEQFELTGRTDYGSGTNLATARANIDGTREILGKLNSLLVPRDTGLAALNAALDRAAADLDAQHHDGRWTPLGDLTRAQRERIDADFGDLLERLAPVAAIFDVRRTA